MDIQTVVVGAGVVGLAVGRGLAATGREVVVIERESVPGTATSSRNSGVIHAGIYYPRGSYKARLCVRGRELLYGYCVARAVPHARCGKLLVAVTESEVADLRRYFEAGLGNGVGGLRWLTAEETSALEPAVHCVAAVHSPDTGIVDAHGLMASLQGDLEAAGGRVVLRTVLCAANVVDGGFQLTLGGADGASITCCELVNAAGLEASVVASAIRGLDPIHVPPTRYARGHYYSLRGPSPFTRLVYPMPEGGGLGIHATLDLGGRVRFGPDVEWVDRVDYRFGADRLERFAESIRRYYPALDMTRLAPDYTGVRPKIHGPGEPGVDFRIDGPEHHGLAGLVNLFGIESPGLTSALAIAEVVVQRLGGGASPT